jgi:hypothetical protein
MDERCLWHPSASCSWTGIWLGMGFGKTLMRSHTPKPLSKIGYRYYKSPKLMSSFRANSSLVLGGWLLFGKQALIGIAS